MTYQDPTDITTENTNDEQNTSSGSPTLSVWPVPPAKNQKNPWRELLKGSALALFLVLISINFPTIGIIAMVLWPIPLIMLSHKSNWLIGLVGFVIIWLIVIPITGIVYSTQIIFLQALGAVFLTIYFSRPKIKPLNALLVASIVGVAGILLAVWLFAEGDGFSLGTFSQQYAEQAANWATELASKGLLGGMGVQEYAEALLKTMELITPAVFMITSCIAVFFQFIISSWFLKNQGYAKVTFLPIFRNWVLPWQLVWVFIILVLTACLSNLFSWLQVYDVTLKLIIGFVPLLVFFGLAFFVWVWVRMPGIILKFVTLVLLFNFFIYVASLLVLFALFDSIIDFRGKIGQIGKKV